MTETSYEKQLRWSREAKRKRTGTCRVCGAETRYAGRPGEPVSELCPTHAAEESGRRRIGKGETQVRLLAFLSEPRRYSEIRAEFGAATPMAIHRLLGHGLIERVSRGVYVRTEQ